MKVSKVKRATTRSNNNNYDKDNVVGYTSINKIPKYPTTYSFYNGNKYAIEASIKIPTEYADIWLKFKQIVLDKHGKLKGALSYEILELIKREVIKHESKQHHASSSSNYRSDVINRLESLRKRLYEEFYDDNDKPALIPEQVFYRIIGDTLNLKDERSIKKYARLALKHGCKKVPKLYNIMIDIDTFVKQGVIDVPS